MAALYNTPPLMDFVLSEAGGMLSRSKGVLTQSGAAVKSGTVLTRHSSGKFIPYTAEGAAGPAEAILYTQCVAATGDVEVVVFDRNCEVRRGALTGLDADAEADLLALGIKVRGTAGLPHVSTPAL